MSPWQPPDDADYHFIFKLETERDALRSQVAMLRAALEQIKASTECPWTERRADAALKVSP